MDRDLSESDGPQRGEGMGPLPTRCGSRDEQRELPRSSANVRSKAAATFSSPRAWPLRWLLALFALALLAPLLGSGMFAASRMTAEQRASEEEQLRRTARMLSADVDRWLRGLIETLQALAESGSLKDGDLAGFHRDATAVMRGTGHAVLVVDRNLNQLVNTRVPYGTPLPQVGDAETAREVFAT